MTKQNTTKPLNLWRYLIGTICIAPLAAAALWFSTRPPFELEPKQVSFSISERDRSVSVGGINRPLPDLPKSGATSNQVDTIQRLSAANKHKVERVSGVLREGIVNLRLGDNPNVDSVISAMESKTHSERLSPTVLPAAFDAKKYQDDPTAYLAVVEPGRVWQTAQPASNVQPLAANGRRFHNVQQRESVRLSVRATPGAPVTFTSFDLGVFQNRLPSITVAANEQGDAEAVFTAVEGTIADAAIVAGSPLHSGQVRFRVTVWDDESFAKLPTSNK